MALEFDLETQECRDSLDAMLKAGMTNEQIRAAFEIPSDEAFRQALSRARLGVETFHRKRRLADLGPKKKEPANV